MDTNWCFYCGSHIEHSDSDLYCSEACKALDASTNSTRASLNQYNFDYVAHNKYTLPSSVFSSPSKLSRAFSLNSKPVLRSSSADPYPFSTVSSQRTSFSVPTSPLRLTNDLSRAPLLQTVSDSPYSHNHDHDHDHSRLSQNSTHNFTPAFLPSSTNLYSSKTSTASISKVTVSSHLPLISPPETPFSSYVNSSKPLRNTRTASKN
ncbi:hypothetical protein BB560_005837, partial [Smittium megazygosporum]